MNKMIEWILLDSDAPRDVKREALDAFRDVAQSSEDVNGISISSIALIGVKAMLTKGTSNGGGKIQAIKLFRQETGATLKAAKEAIESLPEHASAGYSKVSQ